MSKDEHHPEENNSNNTDDAAEFVLCLYITGASPNSVRAVANLKEMCEKYIPGRYTLEIIDVYQQRSIADKEQLVALPMLVRRAPGPQRRMVGDMSDTERLLKGLGIVTEI